MASPGGRKRPGTRVGSPVPLLPDNWSDLCGLLQASLLVLLRGWVFFVLPYNPVLLSGRRKMAEKALLLSSLRGGGLTPSPVAELTLETCRMQCCDVGHLRPGHRGVTAATFPVGALAVPPQRTSLPTPRLPCSEGAQSDGVGGSHTHLAAAAAALLPGADQLRTRQPSLLCPQNCELG